MAEDEARNKRVTLADVARAAGVSPAAASLAIRGEPGVGRETRERVVDVARRIGYRGSSRPGARRTRQVTIGLIIKAPRGDAPEANRFYAPVMAGIEELCRVRDVDLLFAAMPVDDAYHPLDVPRFMTDRACDGLIVVGAHLSSSMSALLQGGPPAILVDAYGEGVALDSIVSDNIGGARLAVEHLVGLGHRGIVVVGSQPDSFPSIFQRRRGYELAMADAGLPARFVNGSHTAPDVAAAAAIADIGDHPEVSAAFCCNDDVAIALIQAARRAGLDVPTRLSVVGYDDIDPSRFLSPPLTTLAVDKLGMGRLAVSLLMHRLEYPQAATVQVLTRPRLIERGSTVATGTGTGER